MQSSKVVYDFIERLRERYASASKFAENETSSTVLALTLGAAVLRDSRLRQTAATGVPQVAVVGPTQVGKSTLVNLLLNRDLAEANPLAGHTKHPHGFAVKCEQAQLRGIERYLEAWERGERGGLSAEKVRAYSLTAVPDDGAGLTDQPHLIWDTPDFDSFSSRRYRGSVLEIIAAADLLVVVLSKEKYGDLSVWNMLDLIRGLKRRIIIVVNKMSEDARPVIGDAVRKRLREYGFADPEIPVLFLPYYADAGAKLASDESAAPLRSLVGRELTFDSSAQRSSAAAGFARDHWSDWVAPVEVEHRCRAQWESAVEASIREGIEFYRHQYLETQQYDAFRRAVIRLLELLEVPGLARPLSHMRRVITWPLRKIWTGVRGGDRGASDAQGIESSVLVEILRHMHTALRGLALENGQSGAAGSDWWEAVGTAVDLRRQDLEHEFQAALGEYQAAFAPEIERAGEQLYARLQQHPATLNALRFARVTTDAAGVVLAVKTGGMGINEVVLTPAMLSLTSFLTESAVGSYARAVEDTLKDKQLTRVSELFDSEFAAPMRQVPDQMSSPTLFGVTPAELSHAEQALQAVAP